MTANSAEIIFPFRHGPVRIHRPLPPDSRPVTSIGVLLGSFDPVHRGHQWMVERLLARFEAVLLLIPTAHFEKRVRFPRNATFGQRLRLLGRVFHDQRHRVMLGLTDEVLFVRLQQELSRLFPRAEVDFGMGNDTFRKVGSSPEYFAGLGLRWGEQEQRRLERLLSRAVVFSREGEGESAPQSSRAPGRLSEISSTMVRRTAGALHMVRAPLTEWKRRLSWMVVDPVISYVRWSGLYAV
jgi:cytidyltransferase-like protein